MVCSSCIDRHCRIECLTWRAKSVTNALEFGKGPL